MSNLAQQFISQSYQSVINVGTGSGASINTTLQPLTDGYGTVTPLSVSTTGVAINGTVYVTGSIIPAGSGSYDIGTPTNPFRHAYFSSQSIYLDGHQILSLDNVNNTTLAAPSGSNDLKFVNNITFDSSTDADVGAVINYIGRGINNQTQFNYSGSYNFHNTNGNLTFLNTLGAGDTTSSGSITIDTKNGGNIALHSENIIDIAAVYGDGNVNLNLRDSINSPYSVKKEINLDEFGILLDSNDGTSIRLHNNSGSIILDAQQYVSGSLTGLKGGISMGAANIELTENDGGANAQGVIKLFGPSPGTNLQKNAQGSGSQYPTFNALIDSGSYPADIYAGFQVYDPNSFYTAIAVVGNTYTTQYPGQLVGYIAGGAQYSGSDASMILPASNPIIDVIKPMSLRQGADITGSVNVSGSLTVNGGAVGAPFPYVGTAQITGALLVTGSFNAVVAAPSADAESVWFNYGGFTGNTSVVYPTAFVGLQNYAGSDLNHAFVATYANSDYNYFSGLKVGESEFGYYLGDGNYDYDYSNISLVDDGDQTTTATIKADNINIIGTTVISGSLTVTGGINYASGSNTTVGKAVLNGGNPSTASISNSLVTTASLIFLTKQTLTNAHSAAVSSVGSGTFTITSTGNGDTDIVAYQIINPA